MFEGELDRVRIDDLHGVDDAVKGDVDCLLLRIDDALKIPAHHLGIEVGAIVELHPLAQVEHIDLTVFQDVPGFSQLGDIIELSIDGEQAIKEIAHDKIGLDSRGEMRIQAGNIRFPRHAQRAARLGLLRPGSWQEQRHDDGDDKSDPESCIFSPCSLLGGRCRIKACTIP